MDTTKAHIIGVMIQANARLRGEVGVDLDMNTLTRYTIEVLELPINLSLSTDEEIADKFLSYLATPLGE